MTLWLPRMKMTAARLNSVSMDWTDLASVGTFETGFTAGVLPPRMRIRAWAGTAIWDLEGDINAPSIALATVHHMFTFDVGFRVNTTRLFIQGGNSTGFYHFWVQIASNGEINAGLPAAASSSASTRLALGGIKITNPAD